MGGVGIGASSDSVLPITEISRFLVAAMRRAMDAAMLKPVIRCLIVDDNASFLEAAVRLLEREGMTVAGLASNTADALRQSHDLRPDVVLVDINLGSESGIDLARRLAETDGDSTVILISTQSEADVAELIAATPAAGFVPKSELSAAAIRRLATARRER